MRKTLLTGFTLALLLQGCDNPNIPKNMTPAEEKVYHKAIKLRSYGSDYNAKKLVETSKAIVFHLRQKTCVLLVPNGMSTGWTYTVCYDDKTGALTDNSIT
ncbi:MAG: hypothetical protein KGN98_04860 [Alphaproteobacteria bacterium]|nr:hypothetical protein [Alphaproteobacteria bacterium]